MHSWPGTFTNCCTYQLYWRRCWICSPSLSNHFWHLFIKFPRTYCSSPLLMLFSSQILRFSSSRVRGFVLYTAFFQSTPEIEIAGGVMSGERAGHKSLLIILSWNTCSILRIEIGWQSQQILVINKYTFSRKYWLAIIQFTLIHMFNTRKPS